MARTTKQRRTQVTWYGDDFLAVVEKYGDEALFAAGEVLEQAAERRAPRKTGRLAGSGYVSTATRSTYVKRTYWRKEQKPPKDAATVGFSAPHAHLIESGRRRAGDIRPRKKRGKKALRIGTDLRSRSRYRRASARPFLGPAIEETQTTMVEALAKVLSKRLEEALPGK